MIYKAVTVATRNLSLYNLRIRAKQLQRSSNYLVLSLKNKVEIIKFPDRLRGTVVERWADYWKTLSLDYSEVFQDSYKKSKDNPSKFAALLFSVAFAYYCTRTNPDETNFRDALLTHANQIMMIGPMIRNPKSVQHLKVMESYYNAGSLKWFSFGIFSLLWLDNYNDELNIYKATCSYLQPRYVNFFERIVDVGFLNKWWILETALEDFDVNPEEWSEEQ